MIVAVFVNVKKVGMSVVTSGIRLCLVVGELVSLGLLTEYIVEETAGELG